MTRAVGFDLVDVHEVEESIARFGERYLTRVYTPDEIAYAMSASDRSTAARRLGARFAAKEATIKVLGASERGISPRSIEIVRARDGQVGIRLIGPALAVALDAGVTSLALSMSHEGALAGAVVTVEKSNRRSRIWWKR